MICDDLRPFNLTLTGKVIVRLIVVSGPVGSPAHFDLLEILRIRAVAQSAIRLLIAKAATNVPVPQLTFQLRTDIVNLTLPSTPNPNPNPKGSFEPREQPWRDAALLELVGLTGGSGLEVLRQQTLGTANGAASVFVTGYEAEWAGYSLASQAKAVISWPLLDRPGAPARTNVPLAVAPGVVAHELCHLFGAPDEYASSSCTVLREGSCGFGSQDFPNLNCENGGGTKVPCLMRDPSVKLLCNPTRAHLGWPI